MAEFDVYYKLLGIPPEEQPPNYYRLLGLKVFESDQEAIRNSAEGKISHVRRIGAHGEHADAIQRLLNELTTAKLCLLNPSRKDAYDQKLGMQLSPLPTGPQPSDPSDSDEVPLPPAVGSTPNQTWIIGRAATCDIVVASASVSLVHCKVVARDGELYVDDLGSTNGTYVNGVRVKTLTRVTLTDTVTLGSQLPLRWPQVLSEG